MMVGTPALSRPYELWMQLNALRSDIFKNEKDFQDRYCRTTTEMVNGRRSQNKTNLNELHTILSNTVMV